MVLKKIVPFILLFLIFFNAPAAQDVDQYKVLRAKFNASTQIPYQTLKQNLYLYQGKVIELVGRINGIICSQDKTTILIKTPDSQEAFINVTPSVTLNLIKVPVGTMVSLLVKVIAEPEKITNQPNLQLIDFILGYIIETPQEKTNASATQVQSARNAPQAEINYQPGSPPSRHLSSLNLQEIIEAYKKAVLYFNKRLKPEAAELIAKSIIYYSSLYKVDARLVVAVIAVESGFKITAVSYKGAMGLGQLMPKTAAGIGVKDPFNPVENIWGAVRLIAGHLDKFAHMPPNERIALALACYNAGSGAVKKYKGIPPYSETINYIKKVAKLYKALCGVKD